MDETLQKYKDQIEKTLCGGKVTWIGWSNEHFNVIDVVVKPMPPIQHVTIRLSVEETKPV